MSQPTHADGHAGPVVVGCDGSWPSAQAVIAAARMAHRRGTPLKLLAVERPSESRGAAAERARSVAETARMQAHSIEPAVETDVLVVTDIRDQRVDQLANEASVLVLGAYGGGGQVALSLGSTSEALSRAFACPILLPHARVGESLRAGTRPPTVVAAVSHDDTAQHVVAAAAREAAERHTPLLIVHAISMQDAAQIPAEHDWIAAAVAGAGVPSWLPHRTVVTVADPTAAVLDRVEPDDLLVVATRGEGRLAGLVAGSVTRALLDAGPCDVLVVNHGATHPTSGLTSPPAQVRTPTDIVTLTDTECWSLLRSAAVGRLGVTVKGHPRQPRRAPRVHHLPDVAGVQARRLRGPAGGLRGRRVRHGHRRRLERRHQGHRQGPTRTRRDHAGVAAAHHALARRPEAADRPDRPGPRPRVCDRPPLPRLRGYHHSEQQSDAGLAHRAGPRRRLFRRPQRPVAMRLGRHLPIHVQTPKSSFGR